MDTNGPINPSSNKKPYIHVITDVSHFVVTVPIKANNPKQQSKLFYTIGLLNLDHPYTLLLIEDQNMSIKKRHTFVR